MNMLIFILLGIIAVAEVLRLILTHRKTSKKAHFKQKYEGVQKMIWDLEFKVFKTREIREDIRKEYDFMQARIEGFKKQITETAADAEERKRLEDQLALAERDSTRMLQQLKQLDLEVNGSKPTSEYPDGATGIVNQIESLHELKDMLHSWLNKKS